MAQTIVKNKIRRLRFDAGEMSQQTLADRVGVTRQTINAIELGKHSPSLELAFFIADAFECTVEDVFFRKGGSDPDDGETVVPLRRATARRDIASMTSSLKTGPF